MKSLRFCALFATMAICACSSGNGQSVIAPPAKIDVTGSANTALSATVSDPRTELESSASSRISSDAQCFTPAITQLGSVLNQPGLSLANFANSLALCLVPDPSLYVAERNGSGDVKVFDIENLAKAPAVIGPLSGPEGVAVAIDAHASRLYVSEDFSGGVKIYSAAHNTNQLITTLSGFNDPSGVAVDWFAKRLFVTELGDVKVFDTSAGGYKYITTLGSSVGITDPGGITVDALSAKLYVAQGTNNVKIFDTRNLAQMPATITGVSQPGGVAIDPFAQKAYITENDVGDVRVYSTFAGKYRYLNTIATGLSQPFGDAVDPIGGKLYVVENGKGDVKIYNTRGATQSPATIGGLSSPWALAVSW